jgi:hypothetical protein
MQRTESATELPAETEPLTPVPLTSIPSSTFTPDISHTPTVTQPNLLTTCILEDTPRKVSIVTEVFDGDTIKVPIDQVPYTVRCYEGIEDLGRC